MPDLMVAKNLKEMRFRLIGSKRRGESHRKHRVHFPGGGFEHGCERRDAALLDIKLNESREEEL